MLHILRLPLSNVYLLSGERAVLVDTGRPSDAERILRFLREHGVEKKVSLIVLTHGHWDHAGAAAALRAALGARVAVHRDDAELVRQGSNGIVTPTCLTAYLVRAFVTQGYPPLEPDVVLESEVDLSAFGVHARIVPTPGHTPGSISLLTPEHEAIVGDLVMGGYFGGWLWPHRPGLHYFAEDIAQIKASMRSLLAMAPTVVHPGHGGPLLARDILESLGWSP
ncbi:MAG TPA: MBL fold metallo-hydrolase [Gemmataceae bacterium]|nr:MBL fold metallo-hydrolase [Gemmataceae bacterium]